MKRAGFITKLTAMKEYGSIVLRLAAKLCATN